MKQTILKYLIITLIVTYQSGCVSMALRFSPSLIPNLTESLFEECDTALVKESLPADLKLMEGLSKNAPGNRQILISLCKGFTGYAMLFVEEDNIDRASALYLRARNYGIRALGSKGFFLAESERGIKNVRKGLEKLGEKEIEALFWTIMAWNLWVNINLDKPAALAALAITQPCLERVLQVKPDFFYGAPQVLMGTLLASKPSLMGGDPVRARTYFEEAVEISNGRFFLVHYYYARYYAVRTQNKQLFISLLQDIAQRHPNELIEVCLINRVMQQKALKLLEESEDLFL
ncbi:MAG: TRAP transporter TatT component family protein [Desulfatiglans sp.]|jgi:hypothetical protein|nr:TRAP transporter TatT component family protein [Desulfatiglans sp.]